MQSLFETAPVLHYPTCFTIPPQMALALVSLGCGLKHRSKKGGTGGQWPPNVWVGGPGPLIWCYLASCFIYIAAREACQVDSKDAT